MRHKVCREDDIGLNEANLFAINGQKLMLYCLDDGFYATQHRCTHLLVPLQKGKIIDGCRFRCPAHRAEFNIRTGEVEKWANFPPGIQMLNPIRKKKSLQTYPVEVVDGDVFVNLGD